MKTPVITSEYIHVYKPSADIFTAPDSACFKSGTVYENWIPNDFTVIKAADDRVHMIGITHPAPPDLNPASIHDGEWQLFHAVADSVTGSFTDAAKLLPPQARPDEGFNIYAPHIISHGGVYHMFYGPGPIRHAVSDNLYDWTPTGALFMDHPSDRDPHILPYNGGFRMTYVSEDKLLGRYSDDLINWSESELVFTMPRKGVPESPFIVPFGGLYYLFWCIYDGTNGAYDNRTFVYVSDTPERFEHSDYVTELKAHAPEIVTDGGKMYIFSAEHPVRGISAAEIEWR